MDPARQPAPEPCTVGCRHIDITNREVQPFHVARFQRLAQPADGQHVKLVVLEQREHHICAPGHDRIKVKRQITGPNCPEHAIPLLAGTKRQADLAVCKWQAVNVKGVGGARAGQMYLLEPGLCLIKQGYVKSGRVNLCHGIRPQTHKLVARCGLMRA